MTTESTTTNLIKKLTKITRSMRVVHSNPIPPPRSSQSHAHGMQIIKQHSSGWLYSYTATYLYNLFFFFNTCDFIKLSKILCRLSVR